MAVSDCCCTHQVCVCVCVFLVVSSAGTFAVCVCLFGCVAGALVSLQAQMGFHPRCSFPAPLHPSPSEAVFPAPEHSCGTLDVALAVPTEAEPKPTHAPGALVFPASTSGRGGLSPGLMGGVILVPRKLPGPVRRR